jgi:hypothetical protein
MLGAAPRGRLEDDLALIDAIASRPVTSAQELAANMGQVYDAAYNVDLDRYDVTALARSARTIVPAIFASRLRVRDQVAEWHRKGFMSHEAQLALRSSLRLARYVTDMLGELNIGFAQLPPGEATMRGFSGHNLNTLLNPAFDTGSDLPFRSGDLLLMRGMHHNSAAIARIGDVDSQFSHLAIVHTDAAGKQWVVEALIEKGSVITPLETVLQHGLGRCVLFRHKDAELAAHAAALIHDRIRRTQEPGGKHIWYDFSMELAGEEKLFCSKLVRLAFDMASRRQLRMPTFTTRFDMNNRDFLDRIGVTAKETFAPADIELEPDFDLVAEWQDFRVTSRLRLQDLLMDKLFWWMEAHGYKFRPDLPIRAIGVLGRAASHLSVRAKNLLVEAVPEVPPNMTRSAIQAVAMLHKTAEPLLADLLRFERASIERYGRPLHARQIFERLEQLHDKAKGRVGYLVAPAA